MAKNSDHRADGFDADDSGGVLGGLLAEEDDFDRRALWRIGSWGVGATGAVILAVMANQSSLGLKRDQVAAADLTRQAQQIQSVARETQNEARRLAAAIDTLNSDRDRLYSRVTSLEQGLDSVTGAIARQGSAQASPAATAEPHRRSWPASPGAWRPSERPRSAPSPTNPQPAPRNQARRRFRPWPRMQSKTDAAKTDIAKNRMAAKTEAAKTETAKSDSGKADPAKLEVAKASPATPLMATQSMMAPPDPAAAKLVEPSKALNGIIASPIPEVMASAPSADDDDESGAPKVALQRTEFGVDVGSANSVNGLRALWRGLLKSRSNAPLAPLRPIIVVKEGTNGLGMQLRLVAGPLNDAGAAAKICAILTENKRPCETAIFDGQRLSLGPDDQPPGRGQTAAAPARLDQAGSCRRRGAEETGEAAGNTINGLTSFFNRRNSQ